jgi:hypothetical protein
LKRTVQIEGKPILTAGGRAGDRQNVLHGTQRALPGSAFHMARCFSLKRPSGC